MDIAALSVINAQANTQAQAGILLLRKAMDVSTEQGQAMVNTLQTIAPASPPNLGNNLDISI